MSIEALIDNDVLVKGACYSILAETLDRLGGAGSAGVLGAARYVVGDRLNRHPEIRDRQGARDRWEAFLSSAEELEPTADEVAIATAMEEAATSAGVALDAGESQLCSITLSRAVRLLMTGDKRAIQAIESLLVVVPAVARLENRLACLEQVVRDVARAIGDSETQGRVCAEPGVDKAVSICFECASKSERKDFAPIGLVNYIQDLRTRAPTVLLDGCVFA